METVLKVFSTSVPLVHLFKRKRKNNNNKNRKMDCSEKSRNSKVFNCVNYTAWFIHVCTHSRTYMYKNIQKYKSPESNINTRFLPRERQRNLEGEDGGERNEMDDD